MKRCGNPLQATVWLKCLTMSHLSFHSLYFQAVVPSLHKYFMALFYNNKWKGSVSHYYAHVAASCADLPLRWRRRKWSRHVLNFDVVPEVFSGLCMGVWEFLEKRRPIKASQVPQRRKAVWFISKTNKCLKFVEEQISQNMS